MKKKKNMTEERKDMLIEKIPTNTILQLEREREREKDKQIMFETYSLRIGWNERVKSIPINIGIIV